VLLLLQVFIHSLTAVLFGLRLGLTLHFIIHTFAVEIILVIFFIDLLNPCTLGSDKMEFRANPPIVEELRVI